MDRMDPSPQPDGGELASKLVSIFSITVMTALFGIKTYNVQFKYLTYSRWLVLTLYIISWGFTCAGMLFVTTNNGNPLSCLLSELACDIFYSLTKIVIYIWLIEKVWVVSSVRQARWKTPSYRIHMAFVLPYGGIAALLIVYHIAEIEETGICVIGLRPQASVPLLIYDFIFNLYFTLLFIKPLAKIGKSVNTDWKKTRLHDVALRTLAASTVCLFVSFANILALVVLQGRERGVLCLTCCTVDVTINVVTIHWVTNNPTARITKEHNTASTNNDSNGGRGDETVRARHKKDFYHLGIDDDYINEQPMYTLPEGTLGYMGGGGGTMAGTNIIVTTTTTTPSSSSAAAASPPTMPVTSTIIGGGITDSTQSNSNLMMMMMAASTGAKPLVEERAAGDPYKFIHGRFVMITEKDDEDLGLDESRTPSLQESHSSRKSLTKFESLPSQ
ncbi:hypothetical protein BX666DRAFT_1935871 [Dichotomocladium elegans]|nr:hypothetical protein BX666DRAFT_1935871 [Dichotomocladium elegans]